MRVPRWIFLALALSASGCVLISGQFLIRFDLGTLHILSPTNVVGKDVDLNTIEDYSDHKDDLKGLADLAVLGVITNNRPSEAVSVELWITPALSTYTTEAQVKANGVRLWGPLSVASGASKRILWDTSAGLFDPVGRTALLSEVKGDGTFTVYVVGVSGLYDFTLSDGQIALVLDVGI